MDDMLFTEATTAVLANPEIRRAYCQLAEDSNQLPAAIVEELRAHLSVRWQDLRSHSAVIPAIAVHTSAVSALNEVLEDFPDMRAAIAWNAIAIGDWLDFDLKDATRKREITERVLAARRGETETDREAVSQGPEVVQRAQRHVEAAWADLVRVAAEHVLLPDTRGWIDDRRAELRIGLYRLDFDNVDTDGARQMVAPEFEQSTRASQRLVNLMRQVGGGSIGISGPRGIGKSTLIEAVCENREWVKGDSEHVGLFVPAPAEYVPREFLLHLFAKLCVTAEPAAAEEPPELRGQRPALATVSLGAALFIGGLALLVLSLKPPVADGALVGFGILVCAGVAVIYPRVQWRALRSGRLVTLPVAVLVSAGTVVGLVPMMKGTLTFPDPVLLALLPGLAVFLAILFTGSWNLRPAAHAGAAVGLGAVFTAALLRLDAPDALLVQAGFFGVGLLFQLAKPYLHRVPPRFLVHVMGAAITAGVGIGAAAAWGLTVPPPLLAGGVLAIAGASMIRMAAPRMDTSDPESPAVVETRALLARIRYQSTITTGWTEAVKLGAIGPSPLAVERTSTGGTSQTRAPWTYPEIVADFRDYVNRLVGRGAPLVIGIDELDQLSVDAASRF